LAVVAYILVTLKSGSERDTCRKIADFEEVVEVSELYGEYDAILKIRVENLSHLDTFTTEKLRAMPDVYLTSTMIVAKHHKGK